MDKLQQYKKEVDAFLAAFLASKQKDFARVNAWGPDAIEKIRSIVSEGKTIRGSLVLLIHDVLKGKQKEQAIKVAAAYECIHTALLVHDDIMDHDSVRRGKPALHVQYNNEGLAICVGDILFFLADELLDQTPVQKISAQVFQEVCIAQMQDVSFGLTTNIPAKDEILTLYKYKTARYTFSLPMMAGAMLAGADKKTIDLFEHLGEAFGILFQIQDDKLDNENNPFTQQDIHAYKQAAKTSLDRLTISKKHKEILSSLLSFVITRKR
ncbi:MAG: polyprenyl synthetase family protein [Candidatus Gottesmanbacteria bacterium]|nr:polyprenyl synthetase family protein [Candidatus Gottesmanbacteria bacterium]